MEFSVVFRELFRLIRSLPSQSPDKSGVIGELCRICSAFRKENVTPAAQRGEGLGARLAAGGVSSVQSGHMVSLGKLRATDPAFASWTISNASSNEYRPASARRFVYP
jgi:hypothetical protein